MKFYTDRSITVEITDDFLFSSMVYLPTGSHLEANINNNVFIG
jgi:hypothetical protein